MFIVHPRVPILKCSPFIHPQRTEPSVRCCDLSNVSRNLVHPGWNDQVSAICCPRHEQICCQRHHEQTKGTACLGKNCIFFGQEFSLSGDFSTRVNRKCPAIRSDVKLRSLVSMIASPKSKEWVGLQLGVYHETLISTFSSELRQKLTYDLVSF